MAETDDTNTGATEHKHGRMDTLKGGLAEQAYDKGLNARMDKVLPAFKQSHPKDHDELCSYWSRHPDKMRNEVLALVWIFENILHSVGMAPTFRNIVEGGLEHLPKFMDAYMKGYTREMQFPEGFVHPEFEAVHAFKLNWQVLMSGQGLNLPWEKVLGFRQLFHNSTAGRKVLQIGKEVLDGAPQAATTFMAGFRKARPAKNNPNPSNP